MQCSKFTAAILLCLAAFLLATPHLLAEETTFNQTYEQTLAKAQGECKTLWSSHAFDWLRQKIPLDETKPSFSMLTNKERLHPKDKPRADLAIKTNEQCRQAYAPVYAMLPAGVRDMIKGLEARQDAVIAQLYIGKITFGEFNVKWSQLRGEHFSALSGIPQTPPSPSASSSMPVKIAAPTAAPQSVARPAQSVPTIPVATQPSRIALVIGNSNYVNLPKLSNPANDARSIHDALQQMGFISKLVLDASEQDTRRAIRKFANDSATADIALVFYAGHGAQINGDNYLLPVDMDIAYTEADIQLTGLKVDDLVNGIRSNTKIVFLDACRDNPALFKNLVHGRSAARAVGLAPTMSSNLDQVKPGGGVFIAYATASGSIAEDGTGKHSPFTQALLRYLQKPVSITDMFSLVTKEVHMATKTKQRPYQYASLENIICLTGNCQGAPNTAVEVDPVQQAQRSELDELQIALQTNNPAALETYLQKYPDSPKRTEVFETISKLRRSEFNEWTVYGMLTKLSNWFMQINSIEPLGHRVAVRIKFTIDPALPSPVSGRTIPDAAYGENVTVFDCDKPRSADAENTIYNTSGATLYHYKWADPRYLDLSIGVSLGAGTIGAAARNILCHDEMRRPLLAKKQLAAMNFASLSSLPNGEGDIFYVPMERGAPADDLRDIILIIRNNNEVGIKARDGSILDHLPYYRTEVDWLKLRCLSNEFAITKSEYFDASPNLVYWMAPDPSINWQKFIETSPYALLQRIICPNQFAGRLGVQVVKDDNSIKVVRVFDEAPAQKAGVKVNDIITHLDDGSVEGMTLDQAVEKMRGDANTKIKLRIIREGQSAPIELSITRGGQASSVQPPSAQTVPWPSVLTPSVPWPSMQTPSIQWPSVQGQAQ
jgi:uncharacterized caspase-like protein